VIFSFDKKWFRRYIADIFLKRETGVLTSEDLGVLTGKDLHEIFSIIHLANCHLRLPEMQTRIARSLKQAFQAKGVVFLLGDKEFKAIDNNSLIGAGVDLHYLDPWIHHYCHHDPFQLEARSRNAVCKVDDILPYRQWVNLPIYTEFYRPQNIHHKLSIYLRSNAKVLGLIGLFRPKGHQDFSRREMAKARILAPHLSTALENIFLFSEMDEAKNLSGEWGDMLPLFGFMILDEEFRPIYSNSEAREFCLALLKKQKPQAIRKEIEKSPVPGEILQDCVELKALFQRGNQPTSLRRQRMMDAGQNKRFQVISSLVEHSFQEVPSVRFVIYLLDFSEICRGREEALREKYQLTKREIDIVRSVSQGLTNDEIGEKLYISRFTVETHLKNIFDKTKVKHRTGLASLLQSV
jgi:DNA-binding CsgD family transcriptional regulator